jgi:LysM repeat protein
MTRKQAVFIIVVNALISTLISLCIAFAVIMPERLTISENQPVTLPPAQGVADTGSQAEMSAKVPASISPTATPITYVVQPGDTISSLSLKFQVAGTDIIAANQIRNPDFLVAGVELTIPVGGLPPVTATWTPVPTVTHTPLPFEPPSASMTGTSTPEPGVEATSPPTMTPAGGEQLVEITEILGVGDLEQERVNITNSSDELADMTGWTLANPDGSTYIFPNYRLWPGGTVTVHTRIGQDGEPITSLFWGRLEPAWVPGETATLRNADGVTLGTHMVSP